MARKFTCGFDDMNIFSESSLGVARIPSVELQRWRLCKGFKGPLGWPGMLSLGMSRVASASADIVLD